VVAIGGTGVADVSTAVVVAGCAGVEDVHPANNTAMSRSPATIPMRAILCVFEKDIEHQSFY
jgi:hypothetical protein